jgi:hypothetical protein
MFGNDSALLKILHRCRYKNCGLKMKKCLWKKIVMGCFTDDRTKDLVRKK